MRVNPSIFQMVCVSAGLPKPTPEHRFSPPRRWRFDFAFIEEKTAIEVDGGIWIQGRHSGGSGQIGDMEKFNAATLQGWRVLHFTPQQLLTSRAIEDIKNLVQKVA